MVQYGGMNIDVRRIDAARAVVEIRGEIDTYTAPRAKTVMLELLDEGHVHLIVNLQHIGFIDSTGLGMLLGTLRRLRECDGSLRLVAPPAHIRRLMEITRLTLAFPIDSSEEDAVHMSRQNAKVPGDAPLTT